MSDEERGCYWCVKRLTSKCPFPHVKNVPEDKLKRKIVLDPDGDLTRYYGEKCAFFKREEGVFVFR